VKRLKLKILIEQAWQPPLENSPENVPGQI